MNNEVEVKVTKLEDGIEYYVLSESVIDNKKYYYLVNMNDEKDVCVRKQEIENGEEYLVTLDSIEELTKVLQAFREKHLK